MTIQVITPLPTPVPSRLDPVNFATRADAFLASLPTFGDELNDFASEANALALDVQNNKNSVDATYVDMQDLETTMEGVYNNSVATSNFKGIWDSLTGALLKPASVFHNNSYWILLENIADITLSEPSDLNTDWLKSNLRALDTTYDHTTSYLSANNVQEAIDEVYDYASGYLGNGSASNVSDSAKKTAREWLGVGSFGFKNRFINPTFSISQEFDNASTTIIAVTSIKYVVDQWYASCTGANISAQQIAGVGNQKYSLQLTGGTGNTGVLFGQRLESENVYDLKNNNCTVSFKAKSSVSKTVSWAVRTATVEDNFTSTTTIATGTINTTSTLTNFQFTFNAGANAGNGLAIEFYVSSLLNTQTIVFDEMQYEKSSIATEFEKRSIQQETMLCLRYYEAGQRRERYLGGFNNVITNRFSVQKRVTPSVIMYSGSVGNAINVSGSNVAVFGYSITTGEYAVTTNIVGTANTQYLASWTLFANARL